MTAERVRKGVRVGNKLQVRHIQRYHRHLQRLGRATSIEHTCRLWVARFAALWRQHQDDARPRRCAGRDAGERSR